MADRESASDAEEEKPKKKKPRVLQKYRAEYALKYPVIRKSTVGETYANCCCTVCSSDFSIAHGGIGDVDRHVRTAKRHATRLITAWNYSGELNLPPTIIFMLQHLLRLSPDHSKLNLRLPVRPVYSLLQSIGEAVQPGNHIM